MLIRLCSLLLFVAACAGPPPSTIERARGPWPVQRGATKLVFDSSATSNLAYQIGCLARSYACSRAVYRDLWQRELGWSTDDDAFVTRLRRLADRYDHAIERSVPDATLPFWWSSPLGEVNPAVKLTLAGVGAHDVADLGERLGLVVAPGDRDELPAILAHFRPRFEGWWRRGPSAEVEAFAARVVATMDERGLFPLVQALAAFDGFAATSHPPLVVHYLVRPHAEDPQIDQMIENHAFVEIVAAEPPDRMLDATLHELQHYFFGDVPYRLWRAFAKASGPSIWSAFSLLDESIATSSQVLVLRALQPKEKVDERLARPRSLYDDDAIDRVGKAFLPTLEAMLSAHETVDADAFVARFIAVASAALGPELDAPLLRLRTSIVGYENETLREPADLLHDRVHPLGMSRRPLADVGADLERYPELSAALFVSRAGVARGPALERMLGAEGNATLVALAREESAFLYAFPRSPRASIYVFVGDDAAAQKALVERFARAQAPLSGRITQ